MKRKFLEDLGLTKEQIDGIMAENGKDINDAKGELETIKTELNSAKSTIQERDTQLEALKKREDITEEQKKQIENLQAEIKKKDEESQAVLKDMKINNAIKLAIAGKVHDEDLAAGLFDKSKLILGDDGKVTGLDEQLKSLGETKKFLFKEDTTTKTDPKPGFKIGGDGKEVPADNKPTSLFDAVAAHFTSNK